MEHLLKRIISNPEIFSGKPIIRGYRIRVQDILEMLAGGMKEDEILRSEERRVGKECA